MDSALRPRDIQARIRAGESPEDVAASRPDHVDAIMPFAAPVLAERAHVAESAQGPRPPHAGDRRARTSARRSPSHLLGEHVATTRTSSGTPGAARTAAGPWSRRTLAGGRPARRVHPRPPGRYVVADNDEARILTGELRAAEARRRARRPAAPAASSVPSPRTSCRSATTRSSWSATGDRRRGAERPSRRPTRDADGSPAARASTPDDDPPTPAAPDEPGRSRTEQPTTDRSADAEAAPSRRGRRPPRTRPSSVPSRDAGMPARERLDARAGRSSVPELGRDHVRRRSQRDVTSASRAADATVCTPTRAVHSPWPTSSPAPPASSVATWSRSCSTTARARSSSLVPRGVPRPARAADRGMGQPTRVTPVVGDLASPTSGVDQPVDHRAQRARSTTSSTSPRSTT